MHNMIVLNYVLPDFLFILTNLFLEKLKENLCQCQSMCHSAYQYVLMLIVLINNKS